MKFNTNILLCMICLNVLLTTITSFKLSKKELNDAANLHPAFLQKSETSVKANLKMNLKKNKQLDSTPQSVSSAAGAASSGAGAKGEEKCYCSPSDPNNPSVPSSSSSDKCVDETGNPYTNPQSKPPTKKSGGSEGTKACISDPKATNATGHIGPLNLAITKPPYKLHSCDQVLVIDGSTFKNPKDYSWRKSQTFTLSVYMINQFDNHDGKTMKNHILLENVTELPDTIQGAPKCLDFIDNKNINRIQMCFSSVGEVRQVKEVFMDFMKCRMGDTLKNISTEDVRRVFEASCLGQRVEIPDNSDTSKLITFLAPFLPPSTEPKPTDWPKVNPAWGFTVPGSPENKEEKLSHSNLHKFLNTQTGVRALDKYGNFAR